MSPALNFSSGTLLVRPWPDQVIDSLGFDPRSDYVETFWLGVLGPSTTWLLRRLVAGLEGSPHGFELGLAETAHALGLGDRGGMHSPCVRAINRTVVFELAAVRDARTLAVRLKVPPLSRRQLAHLSPELQEAHRRWQEGQLRVPTGEQHRRRSRLLALSLMELGEDMAATERQLLRWRHHPVLARDAVAWAWERHRAALAEVG
jgi:hypothetical protein